MFSIYKVSTLAIVAAISASALMSIGSVARAEEPTAASEPMVVAFAQVSRTEARRIVREQLKADGKRSLRVGETVKRKGTWIVTVTTIAGITVYKVKVDADSGELSRA